MGTTVQNATNLVRNFIGGGNSGESQTQNNGELIRVLCPRCHGTTLEFFAKDSTVTCYACDSTIPVSEIYNAPQTAAPSTSSESVEELHNLFASFESPESGLIYLEHAFSNFDWESYKNSSQILIPNVESMVNKNSIKFGAQSASWLLDFNSVATPLLKKIEGLGEHETKMAEEYTGVDNTNIMPSFDLYKNIISSLINNKEALLKRLANDIQFATKLGLDSEKITNMEATAQSLRTKLESLTLPRKLSDVSAIAERQRRIDEQKINTYRERGIDAPATYQNACKLYASEEIADVREALRLFESIRDYSDSLERIENINRYYNFHNEFFRFFGKDFVYKQKNITAEAVNPDAKGKEKENKTASSEDSTLGFTGTTYQLYEVVDHIPSENPIISQITTIITAYGNKLFYVKLGRQVCAFDFATMTETTILSGSKNDIEIFANKKSRTIYTNPNSTAIYIRKRLPLTFTKVGCFAKLFGKKQEAIRHNNNYSMLRVNLITSTCDEIVDKIVDITETHANYLFYTVAEDDSSSFNTKIVMMSFNMLTGEKKKVLDDTCDIKSVIGTKAIYTRYLPNKYNKELRVYDISTEKDTLIESNVYDYFTVIDNRIYYKVGNASYLPLFSNNLDGTDRVEIMQNVERICAVIGNWMYVQKGSGRNAILIKISGDGQKRVNVCYNYSRAVKITDEFVYYINSASELCVVRTDGKNRKVIAPNINSNNLIVDEDKIYYLRRELVDYNTYSNSLYSMDLDGHNVKKIVFNVNKISDYDENTLYVSTTVTPCFRITYPAKREKDVVVEYKRYSLERYYKLDKKTMALETTLTIGMPKPSKFTGKGCFKKPEFETVFEELKDIPVSLRKGAGTGATFEQQLADDDMEI